MSDKPHFPDASARIVANELVAELSPRCERIEIADSLHRGKPDPT